MRRTLTHTQLDALTHRRTRHKDIVPATSQPDECTAPRYMRTRERCRRRRQVEAAHSQALESLSWSWTTRARPSGRARERAGCAPGASTQTEPALQPSPEPSARKPAQLGKCAEEQQKRASKSNRKRKRASCVCLLAWCRMRKCVCVVRVCASQCFVGRAVFGSGETKLEWLNSKKRFCINFC